MSDTSNTNPEIPEGPSSHSRQNWPCCPPYDPYPPVPAIPEPPKPMVPGHSILGKGFNIFGRYNSSAARKMLFDTSRASERLWKNSLAGNMFVVPHGVDDPLLIGAHEGSSHVFSSRSDVSEYFAAEAGISARYRVFSGEFKAAFSSILSSVQDYHMGLYSVKSRAYKLRLASESEADLATAVTEDPDFKALPTHFEPDNHENVAQFFSFFAKFGTHYVHEVVMGARLDYFVQCNKALVTGELAFEASMKLEAKAIFFSAKAEAKTTWESIDKKWTKSRSVRISTIGSLSILDSLVPEEGQNFHELYSQWLGLAQAVPMPIEYKLTSIADIFSGAKATALRQAMDAYSSKSIVLNVPGTPFDSARLKLDPTVPSTYADLHPKGFVNCNEATVVAAPATSGKLAIIMVVWDAKTLEVKHKKAYEFNDHKNGGYNGSISDVNRKPAVEQYNLALTDFESIFPPDKRANIIVAVLIPWVLNKLDFPTSEFQNFLLNLGAGDALDQWWRGVECNTSVLYQRVCYGIVGMFRGAVSATSESFVTYYSQDRSGAGLRLESFLEPSIDMGSLVYIPS